MNCNYILKYLMFMTCAVADQVFASWAFTLAQLVSTWFRYEDVVFHYK